MIERYILTMAYQQFYEHKVVKVARGMAAAVFIGASALDAGQHHCHLEHAPWTAPIILQDMTSSGAVFSPQQE